MSLTVIIRQTRRRLFQKTDSIHDFSDKKIKIGEKMVRELR